MSLIYFLFISSVTITPATPARPPAIPCTRTTAVNAVAEVTTAGVTSEEVTEAAQDTITMPVAEDGEFFDFKINLGTVFFFLDFKTGFRF
jgi:hypothetical protein